MFTLPPTAPYNIGVSRRLVGRRGRKVSSAPEHSADVELGGSARARRTCGFIGRQVRNFVGDIVDAEPSKIRNPVLWTS